MTIKQNLQLSFLVTSLSIFPWKSVTWSKQSFLVVNSSVASVSWLLRLVGKGCSCVVKCYTVSALISLWLQRQWIIIPIQPVELAALNWFIAILYLLLHPSSGAEYCNQVFVCLPVCEHISGTLDQFSWNVLCRSPVAVAQSSSGGVAIRYVLPVLWMTSRLAVVGRMTFNLLPLAVLWYRGGVYEFLFSYWMQLACSR